MESNPASTRGSSTIKERLRRWRGRIVVVQRLRARLRFLVGFDKPGRICISDE